MTLEDFGLVSVIVANYNNARYLSEFLRLLSAQTYKNFELIFVDDGSLDDSLRIVGTAEVPFTIVCIEKDHEGVAAARNAGISIANGDFFIFADVDDTLSDNHIETYVKELVHFGGDIVLIPLSKNGESSICGDEVTSVGRLSERILIGEIPGWLPQFGSRRHIWEGIAFIDDVDYAEDVFVIKQIALEHPDAIVCIRGSINPKYIYEQHIDSVTNSHSKVTIDKIIMLYGIVGQRFKDDRNVQLFLKRQMLYAYSLALKLGDDHLIRQIKNELLHGNVRKYVTQIEKGRILLGLFSIRTRLKKFKIEK